MWAYQRSVRLRFIEPGKPVQNGYIESFCRRSRDECLNEPWLVSLPDAQEKIEVWRGTPTRSGPKVRWGIGPSRNSQAAGRLSPLAPIAILGNWGPV